MVRLIKKATLEEDKKKYFKEHCEKTRKELDEFEKEVNKLNSMKLDLTLHEIGSDENIDSAIYELTNLLDKIRKQIAEIEFRENIK